ncbi:hypothetical protein K4A83_21485 [Spirulina subsalsa FACHB-351]|uniref:Uncharacterized protein n=1 Tax=Spirulina subsalsa FACHB-351 TaxID=234711 RepID=A0ABT3LBC8_9CYAN|nr:hypothetical protein [Spirulina subsalsa]MCW6038821.1 hypothetical protein [Spirulina subsalsa FACHB-351]
MEFILQLESPCDTRIPDRLRRGVVKNTVLVTVSTLIVCVGGDLVVSWLGGTLPPSPRGSSTPLNPHHREDVHDIRRY